MRSHPADEQHPAVTLVQFHYVSNLNSNLVEFTKLDETRLHSIPVYVARSECVTSAARTSTCSNGASALSSEPSAATSWKNL